MEGVRLSPFRRKWYLLEPCKTRNTPSLPTCWEDRFQTPCLEALIPAKEGLKLPWHCSTKFPGPIPRPSRPFALWRKVSLGLPSPFWRKPRWTLQPFCLSGPADTDPGTCTHRKGKAKVTGQGSAMCWGVGGAVWRSGAGRVQSPQQARGKGHRATEPWRGRGADLRHAHQGAALASRPPATGLSKGNLQSRTPPAPPGKTRSLRPRAQWGSFNPERTAELEGQSRPLAGARDGLGAKAPGPCLKNTII